MESKVDFVAKVIKYALIKGTPQTKRQCVSQRTLYRDIEIASGHLKNFIDQPLFLVKFWLKTAAGQWKNPDYLQHLVIDQVL